MKTVSSDTNPTSGGRPSFDVRGPVWAWTIFSTTFVWTPTMRLLYKPEIAHWNLLGLSGSGRTGSFLVLPGLVVLALALFYLRGRGRFRPLFHGLLLAWHVGVTSALAIAALRFGPEASFIGAAWGIEIPLWVLVIPFALFAAGAVAWVWQESRRQSTVVATRTWQDVVWRRLILALALVPPVALAFRSGAGYDGSVKLAIALTVVQWILLAEALGEGAPTG